MNAALPRTLVGLLTLWSLSPISVFAAPRAQRRPKTAVQEIRAVLDRQVDAWNRHDLEGFMEYYWKSEDLTFFSVGTRRSGWQETIAGYKTRYQSEGREMGHLDFSDIQIEPLGPRAAYVRGHWHLDFSSGKAGGLFTLIFRKLPQGWRIVHDHTSNE